MSFQKANVTVPKPHYDINPVNGQVETAKKENQWLEHAIKLMSQEEVLVEYEIAWSAYHSSFQSTFDDLHLLSVNFCHSSMRQQTQLQLSSMG